MNKKYKVGDIVYYNGDFDSYNGETLGIKTKISELIRDYGDFAVYRVLRADYDFRAFDNVYSNEMFDTKEEAILQGKKEIETLKENYKNKIQSVEDLLLYPLKNFDISIEYTDLEVITAYVEKVKEFFNIDLSEKF